MSILDIFQKGGKYFGKEIQPHCEYCDFGKRAKDGDKVLCDKRGLVDASFCCNKFVYSPLKRIPVKQLDRVGFLSDEYGDEEIENEEQPVTSARPVPPPLESVPTPAPKPAPAPVAKPAPTPQPAPAPVVSPEPIAVKEPVKETAPAAEEPAAPADTQMSELETAAIAAEQAMQAAFQKPMQNSNHNNQPQA